ncbi:MAG: hypothetical protein FWC24_02235, partial [Treponema sp.]|nr:hypothetical protein [Treponema sp.]
VRVMFYNYRKDLSIISLNLTRPVATGQHGEGGGNIWPRPPGLLKQARFCLHTAAINGATARCRIQGTPCGRVQLPSPTQQTSGKKFN